MTHAVIKPVVESQARPLDAIYPIVYLDCIAWKNRQDKRVISKAICLALGVNLGIITLYVRIVATSRFYRLITAPSFFCYSSVNNLSIKSNLGVSMPNCYISYTHLFRRLNVYTAMVLIPTFVDRHL